MSTVVKLRRKSRLTAKGALEVLRQRGASGDGWIHVDGWDGLKDMFDWEKKNTAQVAVKRWVKRGCAEVVKDAAGNLQAIRVHPDCLSFFQRGKGSGVSKPPRTRGKKRAASAQDVTDKSADKIDDKSVVTVAAVTDSVANSTYQNNDLMGVTSARMRPKNRPKHRLMALRLVPKISDTFNVTAAGMSGDVPASVPDAASERGQFTLPSASSGLDVTDKRADNVIDIQADKIDDKSVVTVAAVTDSIANSTYQNNDLMGVTSAPSRTENAPKNWFMSLLTSLVPNRSNSSENRGSEFVSAPNSVSGALQFTQSVPTAPAQDANPPAGQDTAAVAAGNHARKSIMGFFTRRSRAETAPVLAEEYLPASREDARREKIEKTYGRVVERPVVGVRSNGPGFDAIEALRKATWPEKLLILIAAGLSGTAAYISVIGMTVLFPAGALVITILGSLMEGAKFVGFGVVSAGWRHYSFLSKMGVFSLLLVAALVNAMSVYGWLIASHTGPAAQRTAMYTQADAGRGADLEVAQGRLSDLDGRLQTLDRTRRLTESQKRERASLLAERDRDRRELANTRAGRSGLAANHEVDEATALPIRYATMLAEDVGLIKPGTDPETLIRWLAFMILMCGDPLALGCMVMINSRVRRHRAMII